MFRLRSCWAPEAPLSALPWQQLPGQHAAESQPSCGWALLPEDCKRLVQERLGRRDVARAACVCREWAGWARASRARTTHLSLPAGLSQSAASSMLAAHPVATSVDLSSWRCASLPALLAAVAPAAARLQAVTLKGHDGAWAAAAALAAACPSLRSLRLVHGAIDSDAALAVLGGLRLERLELAGSTGLSGRRLAALLSSGGACAGTLRELDVSQTAVEQLLLPQPRRLLQLRANACPHLREAHPPHLPTPPRAPMHVVPFFSPASPLRPGVGSCLAAPRPWCLPAALPCVRCSARLSLQCWRVCPCATF